MVDKFKQGDKVIITCYYGDGTGKPMSLESTPPSTKENIIKRTVFEINYREDDDDAMYRFVDSKGLGTFFEKELEFAAIKSWKEKLK